MALAKLVLHSSLCTEEGKYPLVRIRNVVDDVTLQASGPPERVAQQVGAAVTELFGEFRRKRLVVSAKKTVYLTNSAVPDEILSKHWDLPATARRQQARNLRTDSSAGKRRAVATSKGRVATTLRRSKRLGMLRKAGARIGQVE